MALSWEKFDANLILVLMVAEKQQLWLLSQSEVQTLNLFSDIKVLQEYICSYKNNLYWDISEPSGESE